MTTNQEIAQFLTQAADAVLEMEPEAPDAFDDMQEQAELQMLHAGRTPRRMRASRW